ncbi:hypothetical protein L6452_43024 [Arctium lappa]|uniref:Uncharacterized protein n=1 Tax=Arctium lappa TaxID=4217 RepID=A0ACB8XKN5_ARCLA|nr:hypothetical protein L6452_43024 [Arctium lappa]
MKTKKEEVARGPKFGGAQKKDDLVVWVGNKVLPVNESITPRIPSPDVKKEKGDRTKTVSRMIELLRWAAAAKSEKGGKYIARKVSQFRNRTTLKSIHDVDQTTNESPKISFRWELESCSTFSSALSISSTNRNDQNVNIEIHSNPDGNSSLVTLRSGNWITTDSDCKSLRSL